MNIEEVKSEKTPLSAGYIKYRKTLNQESVGQFE